MRPPPPPPPAPVVLDEPLANSRSKTLLEASTVVTHEQLASKNSPSGNDLGVFWITSNGEILGCEFDDVTFEKDEQRLISDKGHQVTVQVRNGKIKIHLIVSSKPKTKQKQDSTFAF